MQDAGRHVVFVEENFVSCLDRRSARQHRPEACSHGVQAEVGRSAQVEEHRFAVELAQQDVVRDDEAGRVGEGHPRASLVRVTRTRLGTNHAGSDIPQITKAPTRIWPCMKSV